MALALEVVYMDYSTLDYDNINVYTYKKEIEPSESEDNVYTHEYPYYEDSEPEEYYIPYIFRLYDN